MDGGITLSREINMHQPEDDILKGVEITINCPPIRTGKLNKQVTANWLTEPLRQGLLVFQTEDIFGICTSNGVCVTTEPNELPMMEVPKDSVDWF